MKVKQNLREPTTTIEIVNYDPNLDEALSGLLLDKRQLQKRNIDNTIALVKFADWDITVGVKVQVQVDKQTVATRRNWNEGQWNKIPAWNFQSPTWTSLLVFDIMTVMSVFLNRIRDLIQGEAVTNFAAANVKTEWGSGTTAPTVNDTVLETPIAGTEKGMDAGFPQDGSGIGEMIHQSSIVDADISSFTGKEIGLKQGSTLMARIVLASSISKAANESIRTRVKTTFSEVTS